MEPTLLFGILAIVVSTAIMWLISALILTVGIFLVGKISGWYGENRFWEPFPKALLATLVLTIIGTLLSKIPIPFLPFIIGISMWFIVIMKFFYLNFWEAFLLGLLLYVIRIMMFFTILSFVTSMVSTLF